MRGPGTVSLLWPGGFTSTNIDIITLYRSQNCNLEELHNKIQALTERGRIQLIIGDLNFCQERSSTNIISTYLKNNNFQPLIGEPTHTDGNILDQAHFKDDSQTYCATAELHTKYYTDHKGLAVIIKQGIY